MYRSLIIQNSRNYVDRAIVAYQKYCALLKDVFIYLFVLVHRSFIPCFFFSPFVFRIVYLLLFA
jgi:hypothetical protein